jgi:uncharacterized protein YggT (Ycf19 family)
MIGGFIVMLLGLRIVLRLLGANPDSAFVSWVYSWSTPFVAPFAGIFGQNATVTGTGTVTTGVFDWSALIAFVVIGALVAIIGGAIGHRHAAI